MAGDESLDIHSLKILLSQSVHPVRQLISRSFGSMFNVTRRCKSSRAKKAIMDGEAVKIKNQDTVACNPKIQMKWISAENYIIRFSKSNGGKIPGFKSCLKVRHSSVLAVPFLFDDRFK